MHSLSHHHAPKPLMCPSSEVCAGCVTAFLPFPLIFSDTSPLICLLDLLLDHYRHAPFPVKRPASSCGHRV